MSEFHRPDDKIVELAASASPAQRPGAAAAPPPPPSDPDGDRRRAIHNEQTKLQATVLNTIAAGLVVAGIVTPLTVLIAGIGRTEVPAQAFALMALWFVCAYILHYGARRTMEVMR